MDVAFMILATLVAVEHIYIMCLETIFTKSRTTARTFNMDVEELSRPSVSTLFNVSSTNSEQCQLCVNGPLYIDARLLWKQAIGSNCS